MYNDVFGTISKNEDDIYPPTIADIASEHREDKQYKRYFWKKEFKKQRKETSVKLIGDQDILIYEKIEW